jgi:beta-glucosidase
MQCGGWTISWQGKAGAAISGGTTVLAGIRQTVAPRTTVRYSADGTDLAEARVVLVVVGETPYAEMKGDRQDLSLAGEDLALIQKAKQSGAAVVTVLLSGRPLVLGQALEASDAIVAAWLPGTEGQGVADILFGTTKPVGRLPRTWPRTNDQAGLTCANHESKNSLFPYGFGLNY